jgi:hypothetical protein
MDWAIQLSFARHDDFESLETLGRCTVFRDHKRAKIQVLDPIDYMPDLFGDDLDHEYVLVHELCHLLHDGVAEDDSEEGNVHLERMVHTIASTLVALDRELKEATSVSVDVCPGLLDEQDDADRDRGGGDNGGGVFYPSRKRTASPGRDLRRPADRVHA